MASLDVPDDALDLFCPESDYRHSDIRRSKPGWRKCLYCNMPFPAADGSRRPRVDDAATGQRATPSAGFRPLLPAPPLAGPPFRPAGASVVPQAARAFSGTPFQPAVAPVSQRLAPTPPVNPTTGINNGLPTHVQQDHPFSLMSATQRGRQRRADSLRDLQRDQDAFGRQPEPRDKKMLVSLHFFFARYRLEEFGPHTVKTITAIRPLGRTEATPVPLGTSFPNEQALLTSLWNGFFVPKEKTCNVPVSEWQVATCVDVGTTNRKPNWDRPPWDPTAPVMLSSYKDLIYDGEGRERDSKRSGFVQKGKNPRVKVLGVFVVHELPEDDDDVSTTQPARGFRNANSPAPLRTPAFAVDADDDTSVDPRPSTSGSPASHGGLGRRPGSVEKSAPPSEAKSRAATSTTTTHFVDLTSRSTPALTSPCVTRTGVLVGGQGEHVKTDRYSQWTLSPVREHDEYTAPVSEDEQELFVRPADLDIARSDGPDDGHTKDINGAGPVEEVGEDLVVQVVGRKRKRAKPGSVKPNGAPKESTKRAKVARTDTVTTRADRRAIAATHVRDRIQTRGVRRSAL